MSKRAIRKVKCGIEERLLIGTLIMILLTGCTVGPKYRKAGGRIT